MPSSLEKLVNNLARSDKSKFKETKKTFSSDDLELVTRKGCYPYEYTDSCDKLKETKLPAQQDFYSSLTDSTISDHDYQHAQHVWQHFNFKTLGEYSDWYLKVNVLLLCDVFENFKDLCLRTYGLDPNYYYTAPGMSFDCMLKYNEVKLQLLSDYDQILMMEAGIRGGITQAIKRYSKANNYTVPDYDPTKPETWITYLDATNLYGWAMSQYLPKDGFSWYQGDKSIEKVMELLESLDGKSDVGFALEVDISYPQHLHDLHNDLPYLPERSTINVSKIKKLMTTFNSKQNYVVHYMALKQALEAGLKLEKVHRILTFKQSPWLAKYISLNTEMRKKAENDFEKDFFKLMNNAVFGKTMENVRNRMQMYLVSDEKKYVKLLNKTNFKDITVYNDNLVAVHMNMDELEFNKPIYVGFSILDISKTLMYDFHYGTMKKYYGENIELLYMDTDSLMYLIQTHDFYKDILNKPGFLEKLDTSNLPEDHLCYRTERKKIPGTFTDETGGSTIWEQIALRAKSYGFNLSGREMIKAKGVSRRWLRTI